MLSKSSDHSTQGEFYLVTAPGLEDLALRELKFKCEILRELHQLPFSLQQIKVGLGGIGFYADLEIGYALNAFLKIPTRILLRQKTFKAKDFSELLKGLKKIAWEKYFRQGEVRVKVASRKSRLKIKSRIEEVTLQALTEVQKLRPWRKAFKETQQTVLVKIDEDLVKVSVDTSGEALYKRSLEKWVREAPLRETIASAMVWQMLESQSQLGRGRNEEKTHTFVVVDPLCGSGTLLLETRTIFQINTKRGFAFQNFPSFAGYSFKKLPSELIPFTLPLKGSDLSGKAIESAQKNFEEYKLTDTGLVLEVAALESLDPKKLGERVWVLTNPPYNKRIKTDLTKLGESLEKLFLSPQVIGMTYLWPADQLQLLPFKLMPKQAKTLFTSNGGIPVQLTTSLK